MTNENSTFKSVKSNKKALLIGSAIVDVIVNIPKIPATGGDVFAEKEERVTGGCAYNIGNILQQLDADFDYLVPIGSGTNAAVVQRQLEKDNKSSLLEQLPGDNGWCLCMVEEDGERTFLTVPGIENDWQSSWFEEIDFEKYDYIYVSGYAFEANFSDVILTQLQKKRMNAKIIFDPSPRVSEMNLAHLRSLLQMQTIVHCNEEELLTLSNESTVETGARGLFSLTKEPVIVTLGKSGTSFIEDGNLHHLASEKVEVVDTIGAGDAHVAGTIAALLAGESIESACRWGNEIAAKVVQIEGGKITL